MGVVYQMTARKTQIAWFTEVEKALADGMTERIVLSMQVASSEDGFSLADLRRFASARSPKMVHTGVYQNPKAFRGVPPERLETVRRRLGRLVDLDLVIVHTRGNGRKAYRLGPRFEEYAGFARNLAALFNFGIGRVDYAEILPSAPGGARPYFDAYVLFPRGAVLNRAAYPLSEKDVAGVDEETIAAGELATIFAPLAFAASELERRVPGCILIFHSPGAVERLGRIVAPHLRTLRVHDEVGLEMRRERRWHRRAEAAGIASKPSRRQSKRHVAVK